MTDTTLHPLDNCKIRSAKKTKKVKFVKIGHDS